MFRFILLASAVSEIGNWKVSFFSLDLPGMLLVGAMASCFAVWAAFGAMRRLHRSEQTLFSPAAYMSDNVLPIDLPIDLIPPL